MFIYKNQKYVQENYTMLMWTPKMWHMRAQRRHSKAYYTSVQQPNELIEKKPNTIPLVLDNIKRKRHFPDAITSRSCGLRAYFGYE